VSDGRQFKDDEGGVPVTGWWEVKPAAEEQVADKKYEEGQCYDGASYHKCEPHRGKPLSHTQNQKWLTRGGPNQPSFVGGKDLDIVSTVHLSNMHPLL
jgi:hypothetical protein